MIILNIVAGDLMMKQPFITQHMYVSMDLMLLFNVVELNKIDRFNPGKYIYNTP